MRPLARRSVPEPVRPSVRAAAVATTVILAASVAVGPALAWGGPLAGGLPRGDAAATAPLAEPPRGERPRSASPYARWRNGPPTDPSFFPIGVWLQDPRHAARYRAAGINTYVGLWQGPTEAQLDALRGTGMRVVCSQNEVALRRVTNAAPRDVTIIAWMQRDEPDNAQPRASGLGHGPPVPPEEIVREYRRLQERDPTRPVFINFGRGVAWDDWRGRGSRTRHPEDYRRYVAGCDIASFDIYPASATEAAIAGRLDFVARGVERLVKWAGPERIVWNVVECTHIKNPEHKATPAEVRALVWMSIARGSRGIIYFAHEWQPRFDAAALLHDPQMLAEVTEINRRITALAPVLAQPDAKGRCEVRVAPAGANIALLAKEYERSLVLIAVSLSDAPLAARFGAHGARPGGPIEVLFEGRALGAKEGVFGDRFEPWGVHIYRLCARR